MTASPVRARPAVAVLVAAALLLAGCGGGAGTEAGTGPTTKPGAAGTARGTAATQATTRAASPSPPAAASPSALPVAPGEGRLPQTSAFPSTRSAAFRHAMTDLWLAVTVGRPGLALPAFFPLAAYERLKAIGDPGSDWHDRLWHDFTLDVAAAHRLVGRGARLVRVIVPAREAAWVAPGACYNSIGYWHSPQARVVYRSGGGALRSFGIASLISWRGVWYVVHFGAVLRSVTRGIVDQPAAGPGQAGPPGGC